VAALFQVCALPSAVAGRSEGADGIDGIVKEGMAHCVGDTAGGLLVGEKAHGDRFAVFHRKLMKSISEPNRFFDLFFHRRAVLEKDAVRFFLEYMFGDFSVELEIEQIADVQGIGPAYDL